MATRQQATERVIDLILEMVIQYGAINDPGSRVINTESGGTEVVYDDQVSSTVVYGADFRPTGFSQELTNKVTAIVDGCLVDGTNQGGFTLLSDFSAWHFNLNELVMWKCMKR